MDEPPRPSATPEPTPDGAARGGRAARLRDAGVPARGRRRLTRRVRVALAVLVLIVLVTLWQAGALVWRSPPESEHDRIARLAYADPQFYRPSGAKLTASRIGTPADRTGFCDYPLRLSGIDDLRRAVGADEDAPVAVNYVQSFMSPFSGPVPQIRGTVRVAPRATTVNLTVSYAVRPDGQCQVLQSIRTSTAGCLVELPSGPRSCNGMIVVPSF